MRGTDRGQSSPTHSSNVEVTVQIATSRRRGIPHARSLRAWANCAFERADTGVREPRVHVVLRVVDARESRALNRAWRGKDKPTNVLSFPAGNVIADGVRELGDIVICTQVVAAEARAQGKPSAAHWAHMVVHGILHLLGYDHVQARQAVVMERTETRVLAEFDYPDPYLA
jgi:probable rRNA maturation factor